MLIRGEAVTTTASPPERRADEAPLQVLLRPLRLGHRHVLSLLPLLLATLLLAGATRARARVPRGRLRARGRREEVRVRCAAESLLPASLVLHSLIRSPPRLLLRRHRRLLLSAKPFEPLCALLLPLPLLSLSPPGVQHPAPGDRRWLVVPAAAHPVPQPPRRGGLPCRLSRLLPRWLGPGGTPRPGHNWTGPPRSRSRRCRALGCRAALGARAERAVSGMTKRRIAAASSVSGKRWRLRVACFGHLPRRCGAAQARSLVATRARVVRGRVNADDRLNQRSWQAVVVRPRWRWIRRRRQAIAHGGCWQGVQLQGGGEALEQL
mmetsp:Transcript_5462/g.16355  ORF Transcript_5462/g.16355 Transcript_5462/m.16355 type:complete len:322 (+) Transcript_5462:551-1516(+)